MNHTYTLEFLGMSFFFVVFLVHFFVVLGTYFSFEFFLRQNLFYNYFENSIYSTYILERKKYVVDLWSVQIQRKIPPPSCHGKMETLKRSMEKESTIDDDYKGLYLFLLHDYTAIMNYNTLNKTNFIIFTIVKHHCPPKSITN